MEKILENIIERKEKKAKELLQENTAVVGKIKNGMEKVKVIYDKVLNNADKQVQNANKRRGGECKNVERLTGIF